MIRPVFPVAATIVGVSLSLGAVFGAARAGEHLPRIPHDDPSAVSLGVGLYGDHCAACHGADLEGAPNWRFRAANGRLPAPPHDETGHTWHHPDPILFDITKRGTAEVVGGGYESDMIGFGDILSDAEILAVLAYIKSTWPEGVIATHDDINRRFASGS